MLIDNLDFFEIKRYTTMANVLHGSKISGNESRFEIINETDSVMRGSGQYSDRRSAAEGGLDSDDDESCQGEFSSSALHPGSRHGKPAKKTRGRVKIEMKYIENKLRRYTTFSKRKTGIMKKVS